MQAAWAPGPGLEGAWASPDPASGAWLSLTFKHRGAASSVRLRLYTTALVLVTDGEGAGAAGPGYAPARLRLPQGLPRGIYYLQARAVLGALVSPPRLVRFYYLGP